MTKDIVNLIIEDAKQRYSDYNADELHEVIKYSLGNAFDSFCESSTHYRLTELKQMFKDGECFPYSNDLEGLFDDIILSEMNVYTKTTEQEYNDIIKTITNMAEDIFVEMYDLTKKEVEQFNIYLWDRQDMIIEWTILDVKNFTPENKIHLDNVFEECFGYSPNRGTENIIPTTNIRECKELVKEKYVESYPLTSHLCATIVSSLALTYAIINTNNYCGDMGVNVVSCSTPLALTNLGFSKADCEGVAKLQIGETYMSEDYGNGAVVTRMA